VVDLRQKFGLEFAAYTHRTCIIVVEVSGLTGSSMIGIVVDRVLDVTEFKDAEIEDCPAFGGGVDTHFILGIAKRGQEVTILLDIDQILQAEDRVHLAKAA
jgi:purine-binding chemotaxis protein CheW